VEVVDQHDLVLAEGAHQHLVQRLLERERLRVGEPLEVRRHVEDDPAALLLYGAQHGRPAEAVRRPQDERLRVRPVVPERRDRALLRGREVHRENCGMRRGRRTRVPPEGSAAR